MRALVILSALTLVVSVSTDLAGFAAQVTNRTDDWQTTLSGGSETISHLLEAVSGKVTSENTREFCRGVTAIKRQESYFELQREDGAQLRIPRESDEGQRMFKSMDKIELQARTKLGKEAGDYVRSLDVLTINGKMIELHHCGEEHVMVPLVTNQPWLPVKLKGLRLGNIRMEIAEGSGFDVHRLKGIEGIAAVVSSAGIDLNVEPREFWRFKDKRGNTHIVLGVKSLVPGAIRNLFRLPEVVHVHYTIPKKKDG